mmetsp:Transcript_15245/g.14806  ORF Transcript_15245/g.14806 Transcript_15245/m.14806 type:complete len:148 (+) Transcript_15245:618-1061(+)
MQFLEGNIFNNSIFSSFSEIVAYSLSGYVLEKVNIKVSLAASFLLSIAGIVVYMALGHSYPSAVPYMILATKFGISACFNTIYIANATLYPAVLAATAMGICNLFARIATVLAPEVAEVPDPAPKIIFIAVCGVAIFCSFFLVTKLP